eukprot:5429623-Prorocentrum_lima.AAC.1
MLVMIRGKKLDKKITMDQPVPADQFAEHTPGCKGRSRARVRCLLMTYCKLGHREATWNS